MKKNFKSRKETRQETKKTIKVSEGISKDDRQHHKDDRQHQKKQKKNNPNKEPKNLTVANKKIKNDQKEKLINYFFILTISMIFIIASFFLFSLSNKIKQEEIKEPEWITYILDNKTSKRFVDLTFDYNYNPHIFYYGERDDGGVRYIYSLDTFEERYYNNRTWINKTLNQERNLGFFISVESDAENALLNKENLDQENFVKSLNNDIKDIAFLDYPVKIYVIFTDYTLGSENITLMIIENNYSSINIKKELIDDITLSKVLGTGRYNSLSVVNNEPYVIFHTEQGKNVFLRKPNKELILLDKNTGWHIDSDHYIDTIYFTYAGRSEFLLRYGFYNTTNDHWERYIINVNATDTAITIFNGEPYIFYSNPDDGGIYVINHTQIINSVSNFSETSNFFDQDKAEINEKNMMSNISINITNLDPLKVATGSFSEITASSNQEFLFLLYSSRKDGLYLMQTTDVKNFSSMKIESGEQVGIFSSMKVTPNGDIMIAYIDDDYALKYTEYDVSSYKYMLNIREKEYLIRKRLATISIISGLILLVLYIFLVLKK